MKGNHVRHSAFPRSRRPNVPSVTRPGHGPLRPLSVRTGSYVSKITPKNAQAKRHKGARGWGDALATAHEKPIGRNEHERGRSDAEDHVEIHGRPRGVSTALCILPVTTERHPHGCSPHVWIKTAEAAGPPGVHDPKAPHTAPGRPHADVPLSMPIHGHSVRVD